jgi:uncharacterized protein YjiS (DUF1127 family)
MRFAVPPYACCRTLKQTVKTLPNATANDIWLGAGCARPPARNAARRRLTGLPRRWWDRAHSCLQLCELGDHILADFDLQDILTVVPELRNIPSGLQWLRVAIERLFVHLEVGIRLTNSAPNIL